MRIALEVVGLVPEPKHGSRVKTCTGVRYNSMK